MDVSSNSLEADRQLPVAPPPRRRRRKWTWIVGIILFLLMSLVALTPYAIGLPSVRAAVEAEVSSNLRARCHIGRMSFSWLEGVMLSDLRIDNPPEYSRDRPCLLLKRAVADLSLAALIRGAPKVTVAVDGLQVFVEQRADGSTNLQDLAKDSQQRSPAPEPGRQPAPRRGEQRNELQPAFDFSLRDGHIEVRRDGQLVEAMHDLTIEARGGGGNTPITIQARTDLLAGRLALDANVAHDGEAITGKLVTRGLDLEKWRPLIDGLMPDQLTALAGRVEGGLDVQSTGDKIDLDGKLEVLGARIAGPAVQGMDLRGERWTIRPKLVLGGPSGDSDTSAFAVDLGFLKLNGAPAPSAGVAALRYDLDVAALAEFGGPIPALLKSSGSRIAGDLQLPTRELPSDAAGWIAALAANANIVVPRLDLEGLELRDLGIDVRLSESACTIGTLDQSKLAGGALSLQLHLGLADLDRLPTTATLQWRGGKLNGAAANLLRYAVPLFAGLDATNTQVDGGVNLTLNLTGSARKREQQDWLAWLNAWSGDGSVGLLDTTFRPGGDLQKLIEPLGQLSQGHSLGQDGKLRIDSFTAPFSFAQGAVTSTASEWLSKGQNVGLSGTVAFDGGLDYGIDLSQLLKGHKDGEKVLKAFGGSLPKAKLAGSLDSPSLAMPELTDIAKRLLQQDGQELLKKGLEDLFGGKKKKT